MHIMKENITTKKLIIKAVEIKGIICKNITEKVQKELAK